MGVGVKRRKNKAARAREVVLHVKRQRFLVGDRVKTARPASTVWASAVGTITRAYENGPGPIKHYMVRWDGSYAYLTDLVYYETALRLP